MFCICLALLVVFSFSGFFLKKATNLFFPLGFFWAFSSSWQDWFFMFSCSLYISGLLRGQAAPPCATLSCWGSQGRCHSPWQGFGNRVWSRSWQWGVASCWGWWWCMRHKTSRLQSFFLQDIDPPNQGCSSLVPMPTAPFSPLLMSSSLPLKKSNMNGFSKAEGLVWFFPPQATLERLFKLMQCKDAEMQQKLQIIAVLGFQGKQAHKGTAYFFRYSWRAMWATCDQQYSFIIVWELNLHKSSFGSSQP